MKSKPRRTRSPDVAASAAAALPAGATERAAPPVPPTQPSRRLDVFPNPAKERDYLIRFVIPEFTCLCPLTGQPDFAHFTIDMVADKVCIELKSLKLYCWSYRDVGAFHEKVTNDIGGDLAKLLDPRRLEVVGAFRVRGGITTTVTVRFAR